MKPITKANDTSRNKDLSRIHIHKKELGLDDDTYRDMLQSLTGKRSAKDLDYKQRWAVITEMSRLLGKPIAKASKPRHKHTRPSVTPDREPLMRKVGALLADMKLPWAYANGMAKRMFGVDLVQWCEEDQLRRVVAALVYHQKRRESKAAVEA